VECAPNNILRLALQQAVEQGLAGPLEKPALPVDRGEVTPVEREASARILGSSPYIRVSLLGEAGSPRL